MKNIEIFEAISGLLFAELYEYFPLPKNIDPTHYALELGDDYWDEAEQPLEETGQIKGYVRHKSPAGLAKPTVEWLTNTGFITHNGYRNGEFQNVCLTAKGLESIRSAPGTENRLLDAAKNILTGAAKDSARDELRKVFSEMVLWSVRNSATLIQSAPTFGG
ncbi:hypothetical protein [Pseudomonas abyssi]|uniref:hypothetical protein n=1 Tax=Pseudomonas abyssi TaxID=170540 RepID=UPI0011C0FB2D|nr:hypothetical protein [Halopseudomonas gallaeciensis]